MYNQIILPQRKLMNITHLKFIKRNLIEMTAIISVLLFNYFSSNFSWYSILPLIVVFIILIFDLLITLKLKNKEVQLRLHQAKLIKHSWLWYFFPILLSIVLSPRFQFSIPSTIFYGFTFGGLYLVNYFASKKLLVN